MLGLGAAGVAGYAVSRLGGSSEPPPGPPATAGPFGPPAPDPQGVIDLPRDFRYRIISEKGDPMSDGAPIPGDPDGMAAFPGPGGSIVLVRNHELTPVEGPPVPSVNPYDPQQAGGTTAIMVDPDRRKIRDFVVSSGTHKNCAGGPTPWRTWLTCEETIVEGHGYVFEVDPADPAGDLARMPIRDMGFFSHEATAIDPTTGIVYLTEDDYEGTIDLEDPHQGTRVSFLYRFLPNNRSPKPGALHDGGRLQAMAVEEGSRDADFFDQKKAFSIRWVDLDPTERHPDSIMSSAVRFNRLEGCYFAGGTLWFADTLGGEARHGQIFRYTPASKKLELFFESTSARRMQSPDNLVVTPWGDLWYVEDETIPGDDVNRIMGLNPDGTLYHFATNRLGRAQFCGPTFAPDGSSFFVNIQEPGLTLAIWGPFERARVANRGGAHSLARSIPPAHLAPKMTGELLEAAQRSRLSPLEAAALDRLGIALY